MRITRNKNTRHEKKGTPLKMHVFHKISFSNCRKGFLERLAKGGSENIDGNKMIYNATLNNYRKICYSCTLYILLLVIFCIISIGISSVFIQFHWYLKRTCIETPIY